MIVASVGRISQKNTVAPKIDRFKIDMLYIEVQIEYGSVKYERGMKVSIS